MALAHLPSGGPPNRDSRVAVRERAIQEPLLQRPRVRGLRRQYGIALTSMAADQQNEAPDPGEGDQRHPDCDTAPAPRLLGTDQRVPAGGRTAPGAIPVRAGGRHAGAAPSGAQRSQAPSSPRSRRASAAGRGGTRQRVPPPPRPRRPSGGGGGGAPPPPPPRRCR